MVSEIKKSWVIFFLLISFSCWAQKDCTYTRHQHVEIVSKTVPKELKNKILNNLNPDKIFVQKINEDLGIKICAGLRAFHHLKDLSVKDLVKGEHLLTKVSLASDKKGYWVMSIESFRPVSEKETAAVTAVQTYTSPKTIKEIKDSEVVEWVTSKLLVLTNK